MATSPVPPKVIVVVVALGVRAVMRASVPMRTLLPQLLVSVLCPSAGIVTVSEVMTSPPRPSPEERGAIAFVLFSFVMMLVVLVGKIFGYL
ncbi:MAG: hypothetical protein IPP61_14970 [Cytophagaceae bacterium]|nr:hypothetical protein [Cytophagaceae bacterium]